MLASLACSIGIIDERFFVTLILMALLTSLLCGVWFRVVIHPRLELFEEVALAPAPARARHPARHAPPREAVVHP